MVSLQILGFFRLRVVRYVLDVYGFPIQILVLGCVLLL
jgi:hypothetical protein